jgi:hypothetical protein
MATLCDRCGVSTETPEFFVTRRRSFRRAIRRYCPPCWLVRQVSAQRWTLLVQEEARRLDPACSLLELAEAVLGQASPRRSSAGT